MSDSRGVPEKAVVLRTGGSGDFILTVPLLVSLVEQGCQVLVATRRQYFEILGQYIEKISFFDGDKIMFIEEWEGLDEKFRGATVFSFWNDSDGLMEAHFKAFQVQQIVTLESRPSSAFHFVENVFQHVGLKWKKQFLNRSWLNHESLVGDSLWVHPGSGSPIKNAPVPWFLQRIERWLAQGNGERVFVSFGEADREVEYAFRSTGGHLPLKFIHPSSLPQFRQFLVEQAALFIGNDSGPSHLAAALGIPTEAVFVSTNPKNWRPLGEQVKVVRFESQS